MAAHGPHEPKQDQAGDDVDRSPGAASSDRPMIRAEAHFHAGPFPPPETLRQYEDIVPGAAERIIAMGEQEQHHRQHMERAEAAYSFVGMACGLIIGLAGIGGAVYVIALGHEWPGGFLGLGTLGSLVGVFVYGRRSTTHPEGPA